MRRTLIVKDFGRDYGYGRYGIEIVNDGDHIFKDNITTTEALWMAMEFLQVTKTERNEAVHPVLRDVVNSIGGVK